MRRRSTDRSPLLGIVLIGLGAAALLAALALGALSVLGDDDEAVAGAGERGERLRPFVIEESPAEPTHVEPARPQSAPAPRPARKEATCYPTAGVSRAATLRRAPGGAPLQRVAARTEFGSPRVFGIVRRRAGWLGVQAPELPNGEIGWLPAGEARRDCTTWSLHADLSKRRLVVRRGGRVLRTLPVAIGRPSNPTPQGRFSVTDKLRVTDPASPYGCCVLALTGHQTNLPPGWPGGDRLAVHSTQDLSSVGQAASLGCLRSHPERVRWLIEQVPLGAPIFIRA